MRKAIWIFGIRLISVTVSDARVLGHDTNYSGNRPGCLQSLTRKCSTRARSVACTHIYVHDDCVHVYIHGEVAVSTRVAQAKTSTVMPFRFFFYLLDVSLHILNDSLKIPLIRKSVRENVICCSRSFWIFSFVIKIMCVKLFTKLL